MIFFEVKEKVPKKYFKAGNDKMKSKTFFCPFSNARSILELMLCNRNLTKLVYQTLLSSNGRGLALNLSEHLKKGQNFPAILG